MLTVAQVKEQLPQVPVRINGKGKTLWARVTGRKNKFATVTVQNEETLHRGNVPWSDNEFAWETVTNAVNTGRPLNFECFA